MPNGCYVAIWVSGNLPKLKFGFPETQQLFSGNGSRLVVAEGGEPLKGR
jgi:hypothetical protein